MSNSDKSKPKPKTKPKPKEPSPEQIRAAQAAQELTTRRKSRESLLDFAAYTHPAWETNRHHHTICQALEKVEQGKIKRLLIQAPPRHTKSELASRRFPAWYLGRNPNKQLINVTYSQEFALDFGRDVRSIIKDYRYKNVFPDLKLQADVQAAGHFRTNHGGIYITTGIGGSITGRGGHLILIDDPIKNRQDADSEAKREAVWKWYSSALYTRLMPGGAIAMMLTRWHEDDLAARAMESEDWHVISLPALNEYGDALWPGRFPKEDLLHIKSVITSRDWHALYMQDPRPDEGTFIKRSWFEWYNTPPDYLNTYMASDFAVSEDKGDHTEHGVFGVDPDGNIYVLDWWHKQTTPAEWIDALLDMVEEHSPLAWFGEGGIIRRSIEGFLKKRAQYKRAYFRDEWVNPIGDKHARARAFQGMANMGKIFLPRNTEWAERLVDQCVGFPGVRYDDAFDTIALMCRVIDEAHEAIVPIESKRTYDPWDSPKREPADWRVA